MFKLRRLKMLRKHLAETRKTKSFIEYVASCAEGLRENTGMRVDIIPDQCGLPTLALLGHNDSMIAQVEATDDPIGDLDRLKGLWLYLWRGTSGRNVSA
jgi:hypothetical protein